MKTAPNKKGGSLKHASPKRWGMRFPVGRKSHRKSAPLLCASPTKRTPRRTKKTQATKVAPVHVNDGETSILVAIRMRPLNTRKTTSDANSGGVWAVIPQYSSVAQTTNAGEALPEPPVTGHTFFTYDEAFGQDATTQEVYNAAVKPIVQGAMEGLNGTVIAYGQSYSGKTYTMQGSGSIDEGHTGGGGIVHMATKDIFANIAKTTDRVFLVRTSSLEIYNEQVLDLLGGNHVLKVREDSRKEVHVGAKEEIVTDFESLLDILLAAKENRAAGETGEMRKRLARSHTILRITIESRAKRRGDGDTVSMGSQDAVADDSIRMATLNLVDLAGSEHAHPYLSGAGAFPKEGERSDQSLVSLSRVIAALGQSNHNKEEIRYREAKLTHILQTHLSGNANMAMICCAIPSEQFLEETRSTLQFASKAKLVKTHAHVNDVRDGRSLIKRVQRELQLARNHHENASHRELKQTSKRHTSRTGGKVNMDDEDDPILRERNENMQMESPPRLKKSQSSLSSFFAEESSEEKARLYKKPDAKVEDLHVLVEQDADKIQDASQKLSVLVTAHRDAMTKKDASIHVVLNTLARKLTERSHMEVSMLESMTKLNENLRNSLSLNNLDRKSSREGLNEEEEEDSILSGLSLPLQQLMHRSHLEKEMVRLRLENAQLTKKAATASMMQQESTDHWKAKLRSKDKKLSKCKQRLEDTRSQLQETQMALVQKEVEKKAKKTTKPKGNKPNKRKKSPSLDEIAFANLEAATQEIFSSVLPDCGETKSSQTQVVDPLSTDAAPKKHADSKQQALKPDGKPPINRICKRCSKYGGDEFAHLCAGRRNEQACQFFTENGDIPALSEI